MIRFMRFFMKLFSDEKRQSWIESGIAEWLYYYRVTSNPRQRGWHGVPERDRESYRRDARSLQGRIKFEGR